MSQPRQPPAIEAYGVRLRPFRLGDVGDIAAGCADPLTQRFIDSLPSPYTEADARWWVTEGAPAAVAGGGAAYAIADPATDRLLGTVGLSHPVPQRGQAEIGYWVAPWARGRGVATAATRSLAAHAFATGTARLELLTHVENAASQRVALATGFRPEGVRRAAAPLRDGGRRDLTVWVRLVDDPPGPSTRPLPDLPGGRLTDGVIMLRRLGPEDGDETYRLHIDPEVVQSRVPPVPAARDEVDRRCRAAEGQWLVGTAAAMTVLDAASGDFVGNCTLIYDQPATGQAMLGYSLLPRWRGRGYATRTVTLLARWGFDHVGLSRLWAGTLPENVASQRVLQKAGFRREGLLRGRLPGAAGTRADSTVYGLLPKDLAG
ncbi:GNAT family N-acetyltransferase [Micromonospora sp. WMMD1082]|uniref:GNAT family N-acetyltransferase n=1 Tax=Micromonospora sp. WMMD1082 TaxID=3016104 RepID=UPI0024174CCE|nr:GNAT family N-acetyltransferase [Micromonospora sp. WMMD1082]MDG4793162.1 GNAT family N-acetyltransferase [Micromonospora sp. WMMD1082]